VLVIDSLAALQTGEENSGTDRRGFYNRVLAPIKSEYECAVVVIAHPPLPDKDAPPGSTKRPRGSGDILGYCDRAFWIEKRMQEKNAWGAVLKASLEETFNSREGGGTDPLLIVLEDTSPDATSCYATGATSPEATETLGKAHACEWEILRALDLGGGEAYQPALLDICIKAGFSRVTYYSAVGNLERAKRVRTDDPRPPQSGKWIVAEEPGQ
jgi:hypothetical protein